MQRFLTVFPARVVIAKVRARDAGVTGIGSYYTVFDVNSAESVAIDAIGCLPKEPWELIHALFYPEVDHSIDGQCVV